MPLGADDRQSIYLVSMVDTLGDGHRFRASDGSFVDLPPDIKLSRGLLLRNWNQTSSGAAYVIILSRLRMRYSKKYKVSQ